MAKSDDIRWGTLSPQLRWYYNNREKQIARAAQWAKDNKDQNNATRRANYAANRAQQLFKIQEWRENNPEKFAYATHKSQAKRRGIPFLLTLEEWCAIWRESGKWEQRGHKTGQYVMARFGDVGPYTVGNVRIITCNENGSEGNLGRKKPRRKRFSHL